MGSGTYVGEDAGSEASALRVLAAMRGDHSPLDMIAARLAIEPECARLAARYGRPTDVRAMTRLVNAQADAVGAGKDPSDLDLEFHVLVSRASRNSVLEVLVGNLVGMMTRQGLWGELKRQSLSNPGQAERYVEQHRAIVGHIDRGDTQAAKDAMTEHLEAVGAGLVDEIG